MGAICAKYLVNFFTMSYYCERARYSDEDGLTGGMYVVMLLVVKSLVAVFMVGHSILSG